MKQTKAKLTPVAAPTLFSLQRDVTGVCPVRDVLDRVGDQWSVLVIACLEQKTLRFGELKKTIPDISARVLTQTLRNLEQDGLVTRHLFPTIPPRVDYTITELGRSLASSLMPLMDWATQNHAHIRRARQKYVQTR